MQSAGGVRSCVVRGHWLVGPHLLILWKRESGGLWRSSGESQAAAASTWTEWVRGPSAAQSRGWKGCLHVQMRKLWPREKGVPRPPIPWNQHPAPGSLTVPARQRLLLGLSEV